MKMKKRLLMYFKDRMILVLLTLCIASGAAASAVYAKYVKSFDSEVGVNIVGYGDIEVAVEKQTDGSYTIKHDEGSNIPAYIRFAIIVNWKGTDGLWYVDPSDVVYNVPNAQLLDGYYYCVYEGSAKISPRTESNPGTEINGITVTTTAEPPVDGYEFYVQIVAEAIQCMPANAVEDAWGVTFNGTNWVKSTVPIG